MQIHECFPVITSEYDELLDQYEQSACNYWKSEKALVEGRLTWNCGVLPEKIVIGRDIFSADDQVAIRESIVDGYERGYEPGVRTCYDPQLPKSPWVMGLNTYSKINSFLSAVYPEWLKQGKLSELVVMKNMVGLGEPIHDSDHFVFRLEINDDKKLSLEMRLGTPQLRSLESDTLRSEIITITALTGFTGIRDGQIVFGSCYGKNCENEKQIQFHTPNQLRRCAGEHQDSIDPRTLEIVTQTIAKLEQLIVDPSIRLSERLIAFNHHGLELSEWQGRVSGDSVKWMRVYGVRGTKDESGWVKGKRSYRC